MFFVLNIAITLHLRLQLVIYVMDYVHDVLLFFARGISADEVLNLLFWSLQLLFIGLKRLSSGKCKAEVFGTAKIGVPIVAAIWLPLA